MTRGILAIGSRRTRGLTLIELLVVLAIMVLMVSVMPIAFNRVVPSYRLRAGAEQLALELRQAVLSAQKQGRVESIQCQASMYVVRGKTIAVPQGMRLQCLSLPHRTPVGQIAVFPDGTSSGGILRLDDGRRSMAVELAGLSGRVRVVRQQMANRVDSP
jgi:general secretion pathway protein H